MVEDSGETYAVQRNLPQIGELCVQIISPYDDGNGFHFVGCKQYDNYIDIQTS